MPAISIPCQQIDFFDLELERLQAAGFDLPLPAAFFAFAEIDARAPTCSRAISRELELAGTQIMIRSQCACLAAFESSRQGDIQKQSRAWELVR